MSKAFKTILGIVYTFYKEMLVFIYMLAVPSFSTIFNLVIN